MSNCIICRCVLSKEEIDFEFDVCESCEDSESAYGGTTNNKIQTKMRIEKDFFNKRAHRPRGIDKFDSIDTREYIGDD